LAAAIMKHYRPKSDATLGLVIPFRPQMKRSRDVRMERTRGDKGVPDYSFILGIEKYERLNRDDDYRHRMKMNAIAAAVVAALILAGVWLADSIAHV
jgi:hypothetical protein